jgi:hypothetical protein
LLRQRYERKGIRHLLREPRMKNTTHYCERIDGAPPTHSHGLYILRVTVATKRYWWMHVAAATRATLAEQAALERTFPIKAVLPCGDDGRWRRRRAGLLFHAVAMCTMII